MAIDLIGTSMTGMAGGSLTSLFSPSNVLELALILVGGVIGVLVIPRIPYWFDEWIDRVFVIDFDKEVKKAFSKVLTWIIYLAVLYFTFYTMGFTRVHESPLFQLIVLLFVLKMVTTLLKPSVRKLDQKVKGIKVSEGSIMEKIVISIVYLIGLFAALSIVGLDGALTTALTGAGVMGIVIGFGARDLISNIISGIFIALDKPFGVKDIIEVDGKTGRVVDMRLRTTQIKKFDNKVVTIPNAQIANSPVTNYTAEKTRRISIEIGIDYSSNLAEVAEALKKELSSMNSLVRGKEVEVLVDEFGDSSIVLEVRVWLNQDRYNILEESSRAKEMIIEKLREENVNIPFPTRVILKK